MTLYSKIDQPEILARLFPLQEGHILHSETDNAEVVSLEIAPELDLSCKYYFVDLTAPVIIIFPATLRGTDSSHLVGSLVKQGINVFLASYRGCGANSGSPSVAAMYADTELLFHGAVAWLAEKRCTGPLFVMGQSLGSICAIETVCNNDSLVKGLILESAICGTAAFLSALGANELPEDLLEEAGFNNCAKIEKIKNPTLIFHGSKDAMVGVAEAEELQAASGARTKQFFVVPGAEHLTVSASGGELYGSTIKQFMDTVCGVNTWRHKRKSHRRKGQGEQA